MSEILFCPGIHTMAGFCPEVLEEEHDRRLVVVYRNRREAEASIARDAQEWARQAVYGERNWDDAKGMIDSLAIVQVEIDEDDRLRPLFALDAREGCEGCYEQIDYGYLPEIPEAHEGWLANEGGYVFSGEA